MNSFCKFCAFLWLFFMVLCQQLLNHLLRILISLRPGVAKLNDTVLIHDKVAGPGVAEIVAPDLIFVIDDDRILNTLVCDGFLYLWNVLLVVNPGHVYADDDKPVFGILVIHLFDVRHSFSTKGTIPCPKI